jgi:hypothetical protein
VHTFLNAPLWGDADRDLVVRDGLDRDVLSATLWRKESLVPPGTKFSPLSILQSLRAIASVAIIVVIFARSFLRLFSLVGFFYVAKRALASFSLRGVDGLC